MLALETDPDEGFSGRLCWLDGRSCPSDCQLPRCRPRALVLTLHPQGARVSAVIITVIVNFIIFAEADEAGTRGRALKCSV